MFWGRVKKGHFGIKNRFIPCIVHIVAEFFSVKNSDFYLKASSLILLVCFIENLFCERKAIYSYTVPVGFRKKSLETTENYQIILMPFF